MKGEEFKAEGKYFCRCCGYNNAYLRKTNFFEIDACLDCGGRWDYETGQCDTA